MITEQTIREAYIHLRKTNQSIPDETLDFMLEASLEKLKKSKNKISKKEIENKLMELLNRCEIKQDIKDVRNYILSLVKTLLIITAIIVIK